MTTIHNPSERTSTYLNQFDAVAQYSVISKKWLVSSFGSIAGKENGSFICEVTGKKINDYKLTDKQFEALCATKNVAQLIEFN